MIVRLKGVKVVRSRGHVYYYHRKTMTRLPGAPGSPEFIDRLRQLDVPKPVGPPTTLGELIDRYHRAPEYTRLTVGTKRQYEVRFGRLYPFARVPLGAVTPQRVYDLRDRLHEKYSRSAANNTVAMLHILFEWASKRGLFEGNPAAKVDKVRRPKDARVVNRPWRDEEIELVMWEAPPWLRVAIAIAVYTGLREGDVATVAWAAYDGAAFETRTIKTGMPVWVPAHSELKAILDAMPRVGATIVTGVRGGPMSGANLGSRFFKFLRRLRDVGKVESGLTFHGLRHTLGTRLAEAGCDPATIAFVLGHTNPRMTERYTRTADRRRLAKEAFGRLENGKPNPEKMENLNPHH